MDAGQSDDYANAVTDVVAPSKCSRKLNGQLKNLLELNKTFVVKLNDLIERAEKHHRDCLIAKTTGVSVAAVGTTMVVGGWITGLILAVPTFGLSLTIPAVMTVAGTATAVAGGMTTAGTEIANGILTKNFLVELTDIQAAQAMAVNETEETLRKIDHIIKGVIKREKKKDETLIITLVLQGIESGEIDLDNIDDSIQKVQEKLRVNEYSTNNVVTGSLRVAGSVTSAVMVGGSVLIDDASIAILRSIGIGTSSTIAQSILRGVAAGVGVVFTVIDIVRLVQDYNDPNPLIEELKRIKHKFLTESDICKNVLSILDKHC